MNYFKNVIRSREYSVVTSYKIIDENIYLGLLKDEVIQDLDIIRNELNENIKIIFVLVVIFVKFEKEDDGRVTHIFRTAFFHHDSTMKKLKDQGLKS